MQTPRDACEVHCVRCGKKIITLRFFFLVLNHALKLTKIKVLFSFACCGAIAILRQARISHCSVHCSFFRGGWGKDRNCIDTPSSSSSFLINSSLVSAVCCPALTNTHNYIPLYSTHKIPFSCLSSILSLFHV